MGRPTASKTNKELALAFAQLITCPSESSEHIVARCGECSIFALLRTTCSTIVRNEKGYPRDGISEVEFNKFLQVRLLCFATIISSQVVLTPLIINRHQASLRPEIEGSEHQID